MGGGPTPSDLYLRHGKDEAAPGLGALLALLGFTPLRGPGPDRARGLPAGRTQGGELRLCAEGPWKSRWRQLALMCVTSHTGRLRCGENLGCHPCPPGPVPGWVRGHKALGYLELPWGADAGMKEVCTRVTECFSLLTIGCQFSVNFSLSLKTRG